ncbi:protein trafficking Pga2 [Calycina marina]|uniref:Protein trafficking Pga2 n=1 Tax=Calycina marina TaxID=1763456 RepID=A0A9P7Z8T1_9HELO|nr:protein trafficking Pga2 [Calycina marina]
MEAVYVVEDYASNFMTNVVNTLDGMDSKKWIRLVIVIGAYFLIRPWIMKFGEWVQEGEHKKAENVTMEDLQIMAGEKPKLTPNDIRGNPTNLSEDTEDSEEESEATGANWGKKARRRQRQVLKRILAQEEALRLETDGDADDKDIKEFLQSDALVDYKEGEDGW